MIPKGQNVDFKDNEYYSLLEICSEMGIYSRVSGLKYEKHEMKSLIISGIRQLKKLANKSAKEAREAEKENGSLRQSDFFRQKVSL